MSREFTLVLLGAGLLTAGYFLWPEEDPVKRLASDAQRNGGGAGGRSRIAYVYFHVIPIPGRTMGASPAMVSSSTYRGGFGRTGAVSSGG